MSPNKEINAMAQISLNGSPEIESKFKRSQSFPLANLAHQHQLYRSQDSALSCGAKHVDQSISIPRQKAASTTNMNLSKVQYFPSYFNLEANHAYITDDTPLGISSKINECLESEKIQFHFDKHEALIHCETNKDANRLDNCKFKVRIFKKFSKESSSGETSPTPTILVEVQRRSGCCVEFNHIARKIILASKGCEYKHGVRGKPRIPDDLLEMLKNETL